MTRETFIETYTGYSDDQLLQVYHSLNDYSDEAKEAFHAVIQGRGGIEALQEIEKTNSDASTEIIRISQEVRRLTAKNVDLEFLYKMIPSGVFDESKTRLIIEQVFDRRNKELDDQKIRPQTVFGGVFGAIIGGLIGGVVWGLQMMWSGRVFGIILIGIVLLCYGSVKLVTKQSYKNAAVIIFTVVSLVLALFIGQMMFLIFGRQ